MLLKGIRKVCYLSINCYYRLIKDMQFRKYLYCCYVRKIVQNRFFIVSRVKKFSCTVSGVDSSVVL